MQSSTTSTIHAIQAFDKIFQQARWVRWWFWLSNQPQTLIPFDTLQGKLLYLAPRNRGIHEIQLAAIVGSVGRAQDFDRHFRPLKRTLQSRWVQLFSLRETIGWKPIEVYQVGNVYFVQDGHHRVSVAKMAHAKTIEAQVYEYPVSATLSPQDTLQNMLDKLCASQRTPPISRTPLCAHCH